MTAQGFACFAPENSNKLIYKEELEVRYIDAKVPILGRQSYIYNYEKDTGVITKLFADDVLFYELKISGNGATGSHECLKDLYEAQYIFLNHEHGSFELSM